MIIMLFINGHLELPNMMLTSWEGFTHGRFVRYLISKFGIENEDSYDFCPVSIFLQFFKKQYV